MGFLILSMGFLYAIVPLLHVNMASMEKNLRTIFFCRTYFPINPVCFRLQGALLNIFNTSFDKKLCRFRSDTLSHIPAKNVSLCPPAGGRVQAGERLSR